jgi:hypothetical protein
MNLLKIGIQLKLVIVQPNSLPENRRKPTELPTEIIPSPNLSVYTDGFADEVYSLSGNMQRRGDVRRFYRRNYRGIQTDIAV